MFTNESEQSLATLRPATLPFLPSVQLRLPFPSPAEDRKAIKDQIVDMTKKAKGAAAAAARMAGGAP